MRNNKGVGQMQAWTKTAEGVGLMSESAQEVTLWQREHIKVALAAVVMGFLAYVFFKSAMPLGDGFGGHMPLIIAGSLALNVALAGALVARVSSDKQGSDQEGL